jgi:hypothetical protein
MLGVKRGEVALVESRLPWIDQRYGLMAADGGRWP